MRKRRTLVFCACAVLVGGVLLGGMREKEPSYSGRRLSSWVVSLGGEDQNETFEAMVAIDHVGTNALPFLLKWLHYELPGWRRKAADLADMIPLGHLSGRVEQHFQWPKGEVLGNGAVAAFQVLGARATPALPELCRLMNDKSWPETAARATAALGRIGTNGLPALLAVVLDQGHPCHRDAIDAVGVMPGVRSASGAVVPALAKCLSDTNGAGLPVLAVQILADLKSEPGVSVPALVACLQGSNALLRTVSADALGAFGQEALMAVPALTNALGDNEPAVRDSAGHALHEICPKQFQDVYQSHD